MINKETFVRYFHSANMSHEGENVPTVLSYLTILSQIYSPAHDCICKINASLQPALRTCNIIPFLYLKIYLHFYLFLFIALRLMPLSYLTY